MSVKKNLKNRQKRSNFPFMKLFTSLLTVPLPHNCSQRFFHSCISDETKDFNSRVIFSLFFRGEKSQTIRTGLRNFANFQALGRATLRGPLMGDNSKGNKSTIFCSHCHKSNFIPYKVANDSGSSSTEVYN